MAGVHPETVRRAIRSGALPVAGYVGQRPRLRREDVDAWIAGGEAPGASVSRRRGRAAATRAVGGAPASACWAMRCGWSRRRRDR